jgi:hypothetical protein
MSLRFFGDHCVPFEISSTLRQHGHDVILLRDVIPIGSPDPLVIAISGGDVRRAEDEAR